jgi:pilus assembly protein Flp/PilA
MLDALIAGVQQAVLFTRANVRSRMASDRGASAVEYGLLVAAIAAVIVAIVFGLGTIIKDKFSQTSNCISTSGSGQNC